MTMPLPAVHAEVTTPTGDTILKAVAMATRKGQFVVQNGAGTNVVDMPTSGVRPIDATTFEVDTADGTYTVRRKRGCGCR